MDTLTQTTADTEESTSLPLPSYGSPRQFGDRYLRDLLADPYVVQEKIDGSQFSFGRVNGEVLFRSRNHMLTLETCAAQFRPTLTHLTAVADLIPEGFIFRGEAMSKTRHNKLNYSRLPSGFVVLYDVENAGAYLAHEDLAAWSDRLGVTAVQQLWTGEPGEAFDMERVTAFLNGESQLGGTPEGVVVKNYARRDHGKVMMGKIVGSHFKEVKPVVRTQGPSRVEQVIAAYSTAARYDKIVQHLREADELDGSMRDIPKLMRELNRDLDSEKEAEAMKDLLYGLFRKEILSGVSKGLPAYYAGVLAKAVEAA